MNPMEELVNEYYTRSRHRMADQPSLFALAVRIAEDEPRGVSMVIKGMPPEYFTDFAAYLRWLADGIPKGEIFSNNVELPSLETVHLLWAEMGPSSRS